MNLPTQVSIVDSNRYHLIIDNPVPDSSARAIRSVILWDEDRDERIIDLYSAIIYRDMLARVHLLGLAESDGIVTAWLGAIGGGDLEKLHRSIQSAANMAAKPRDKWTVAPLQILTIRGGRVDAKTLTPDHPLFKAASTFGLGQVRS